ncbi:hypothetical protein CONLIGDRAFT_638863 [Coniochaeta ligniaria NRRL 30616]|uniref:Uncharacterized protein n=1 Tax=Coniochaeta ligniaria NRRL 30616 TaxID=1408157 RepID=A0A1J7JYL4_9PEZI|nr:hypothetical protein CONLIGDRAFT_638863 [Coniochaeta ligniaria NRRL 30616]
MARWNGLFCWMRSFEDRAEFHSIDITLGKDGVYDHFASELARRPSIYTHSPSSSSSILSSPSSNSKDRVPVFSSCLQVQRPLIDLIASSAGVDNRLASIFCCFTSFPASRPRESVQDLAPEYSSPRNLPAYTGQELDPEKNAPFVPDLAVPRYLPVNLSGNYSVNFVTLDPPGFEPPPYYPGLTEQKPLVDALKPKPLHLARTSRKQKPPVFYSHNARTLFQSTTYITIEDTSGSSTAISSSSLAKMSATPAMPKVAPALPSGPRPGGVSSPSKDEILADLRRQLDDSASDVGSSVSSRGGRRRRRRNNKALAATGGLAQPAILPRLAETKPVRLQLGLNLDVELELKARIQGDVSLTLLCCDKWLTTTAYTANERQSREEEDASDVDGTET